VGQPWSWHLLVEKEAGVLESYYLGKVSERENKTGEDKSEADCDYR